MRIFRIFPGWGFLSGSPLFGEYPGRWPSRRRGPTAGGNRTLIYGAGLSAPQAIFWFVFCLLVPVLRAVLLVFAESEMVITPKFFNASSGGPVFSLFLCSHASWSTFEGVWVVLLDRFAPPPSSSIRPRLSPTGPMWTGTSLRRDQTASGMKMMHQLFSMVAISTVARI